MLKMILLTMTYIGWLGGWKIILNIDGKDFDHAHDNHNQGDDHYQNKTI